MSTRSKALRTTIAIALPIVALAAACCLLSEAGGPARAAVGAAVAYQAPLPQMLSVDAGQFSSAAKIDANENAIATIWTEGDPASETINNPNGNVELAFKWGTRDWIRRTLWTYVEDGPKAFDSAMALDGEVAHAVWAVKADPYFVIYYLGWNVRLNKCARDAEASIDTCREMVSKNNTHPKTHPDIAVDGNGVPHVVWAEETDTWNIYYDNRNTPGGWTIPPGDTDYRISSLSPGEGHVFQHRHPVIAADGQHVYVAWDLDDGQASCYDNRSGTHFRLRTATTGAATQALWDPPVTQEGVRLSRVGATCGASVFGWPTIDTRLGQTYVMWQYLRDQTPPGLYTVYTYTLQYRVLDVDGSGWWPDAASQSYEGPAELWDATSLYADHAYYSGLRPAIELVSSGGVITPYVAWHAWTPPGSSSGEEGTLRVPRDVGTAAAADEPYVTGEWPYQVFYAAGSYLLPGEPGSLDWGRPVTVPVGARDRILCWPDLALASYDGGASYYLHLAVHLRPTGDLTAKSAWYTNLDRYYFVFLPVVRR